MSFFVIMALDIVLMSSRIWPAACNKGVTPLKPLLNSLIFIIDLEEQRTDAEERISNHPAIKTVLSPLENGINLTVNTNQGSSSGQGVEYSINPKNNNESSTDILPHLIPGKRQLIRQNGKVVKSNNQIMNGMSNQIVGNTPQSAVDMVQSYVEDIIKRPDGERPGYIMINSQNPLIINQLTDLLKNKYGTSSVIKEPTAVQDFLSSKPDINFTSTTTRTPAPVDNDSIPVFPFQSNFSRNSTRILGSHSPSSEADFIKQQLSSIANISISSGKLINETTDSLHAINLKSSQEIPVLNITALKEPSISFVEKQETAQSDSSTEISNEMQHLNQANSITLTKETSTELESADHTAFNFTGFPEDNIKDTLISIPQSLDAHPYGIPTENPEQIQNMASVTEVGAHSLSETTKNILQPITADHSSISQFLFPMEKDSVYSSTIGTYATDSKDGINQSQQNPYSSELHPYLDLISTTGYEDYYEEIDGELVLSPTKFMRKSELATSVDYGNYEYYENTFNDTTDYSTRITSNLGNQTYQDQNPVNKAQHQDINVYEDVPFNIFSFLNEKEHSLSHVNYEHLNLSSIDKVFYTSDHESHINSQENESIIYPNNQLHNLFSNGSLSAVESPIGVQDVEQNPIMQAMEQEAPQFVNIKDASDHLARVPVLNINAGASEIYPIKFPNYQHVQFETPLASVSHEVSDHLKKLNHKDLRTLGILNEMRTIIESSSISENKNASTLLPDYTDDKNSSVDPLKSASKLLTVTETQPNVITLDHTGNSNNISSRPNFSAGNFRQSDISRQQIPPGFFPQRPSLEIQQSTHHHGISNEQASQQLTTEQEQIISRLPVGMQHVVSSIVQALQAPSPTTTLPPVQYPYVYPYPYPYIPPNIFPLAHHFNPSQAQQTSLPNNQLPHNTHVNHHNQVPGESVNNSNTNHHQQSHGHHEHHHGQHSNTNHHQHSHGHHEHHQGHHEHHHTQESHSHQEFKLITESPGQTSGSQETLSSVTTDILQNTRNNEGPENVPSQNNYGNRQNFYATAGAQVAWTNNPILLTNITSTVSPDLSTTKDSISQANLLHLISSVRPGATPAISQSRIGVLDESVLDPSKDDGTPLFYAAGVPGNRNQRPTIGQTCSNSGSTGGSCENRLRLGGTPSRPDRNQGLLDLRRDASHMGNRDQTNSGIVNYRPPQASSMQMGSPVHNGVLPANSTPLPQVEPIPLVRTNPSQDSAQAITTQAPGVMNRQEMNSALHSLFSSPTLLLLGIVFATSAAYMAISMEEQAAQQRFQQAQLAAAFNRQPFPQGRKRRNTIPLLRIGYSNND